MRSHVAVVDPAVRVPELDCFNRMSRRSRVPLTYHLPALFGLDSLRRSEGGLAAIVVLGSGASVNDRSLAWQAELGAWLGPRMQDGVPYLGLCYGHQLAAHLFGGEVDFLLPSHEKLQGMREIRLDDHALWGAACAGPMMVSHREAVRRLPEGFVRVGTSDVAENEAIAHRVLPIWGFQPHPEATAAFARNNGVPFTGDDASLAFGHHIVDAWLDRVAALTSA